ncbi:hypothetical protein AB0F17_55545 [Nonomuraea sp. NPDC026600]|uniref:hypothetical protein n=1 Tax=Nonomuraea sp. NPDC026600 TaxID=3155363 RepID=UPI0033CA3D81
MEGGKSWRNPKANLPAGFDDNRDVHYEVLSKPRDPPAFIADPQRRHTADLDRLETAMRRGTTGGAKVTRKRGEPWISASPLNKQQEPNRPEGAEGGDLPPVGRDRPFGRAQGHCRVSRVIVTVTTGRTVMTTKPQLRHSLRKSYTHLRLAGRRVRRSGRPTAVPHHRTVSRTTYLRRGGGFSSCASVISVAARPSARLRIL